MAGVCETGVCWGSLRQTSLMAEGLGMKFLAHL